MRVLRSRLAATFGMLFLPIGVAVIGFPATSDAQEPPPARTIINGNERASISARIGDDGQIELGIINHPVTPSVPTDAHPFYPIDDVILHSPVVHEATVTDHPSTEIFGPPGMLVYGLRTVSSVPTLKVHLGNAQRIAPELLDGPVTFTLRGFTGPAESYFMVSQAPPWGPSGISNVFFFTLDPLPQSISIAGGTYLVAREWVFTELGHYCLDYEVTAQLSPEFGGETLTDRRWIPLIIGPDDDPSSMQCGEQSGGGSGASQTINVEVPPVEDGALTLSVASEEPVVLPTPVFQEGFLVSQGSIHPVTVTDLRLTNPGWDLSGQFSAFTAGDEEHSFGPERLGWMPYVSEAPLAPEGVTAGDAVTANSPGLTEPAPLGAASEGGGYGVSVLGAELNLALPTDTEPGSYSATLTLTVI